MCGICGAVGLSDPGVVETMAACLAHRGPDDTGTHVESGLQLANQRLSVIDVEGGSQPIYNEDGDVVVVYNGEIYNFPSIRTDLRAAGHDFKTATDTEVLVHGYEEWGTELFQRLNGMFAVALWDATDERLLLARDRVGIKPLYVARPAVDRLLFASEPKGILRSGQVDPAVDTDALQYFLQLRYSPSNTSLFEGIETVLPGQYLDVNRTQDGLEISTHRFWSPLEADRDPPADPVGAVERGVRTAVERQLVSDVPLGFYLSGGLDTSSVVAMATEASDEPVHTFCMGFESNRWDERPDARAVAEHFDTVHHEIEIDASFMADFPRMIWHADEPKRNLYPYYVAKEMREYVTVALGGLGADELFGGYVYRYDRLQALERFRQAVGGHAAPLRDIGKRLVELYRSGGDLEDDETLESAGILAHVDDPARLYVLLNSTDVFGDVESIRDRAFGPALQDPVVPAEWIGERLGSLEGRSLTQRAMLWDLTVKLPNDFLLVEDRMSMAHSLESRVPFLDNDLIDLALSLDRPSEFGTPGVDRDVGKRLLRTAMRDHLPEVVFQKDKQGFTMPVYPFVRDELLDHAGSILDDPYVVDAGLVDGGYLDSLLSLDPNRKLLPHYRLLWKLLALEIWYQMYFVGSIEGPDPIEQYYT